MIGAAFHFLGSDDASRARTAGASPSQRPENQSVGVAYGDPSSKVLSTVGSPTKKQGACWIYKAKSHSVSGSYIGKFSDSLRYCFGEGPAGGEAVTAIEVHIVPHTMLDGKWYPGGWNQATTYTPAPPPPS